MFLVIYSVRTKSAYFMKATESFAVEAQLENALWVLGLSLDEVEWEVSDNPSEKIYDFVEKHSTRSRRDVPVMVTHL